nr:MAG TPA: hypothetical protein [Caudoviricetes sp.]
MGIIREVIIMSRKDDLKKIITVNNELVENLIDELLFMEGQLEKYRKLPQIKVDPNRPERQKATPAAKLYKETLQQYTNVVKVLASCTGQDVDDEESPLRKWVKQHVNSE